MRSFFRFFLLISLCAIAIAQEPQQPASPAAAAPQKPAETGGVPPIPDDVPKNATKYSFLQGGNLSGHQLVWTGADGKRYVLFQFNDRGRGPQIRTSMSLGGDGLPVFIENKGVDYLKGPVEETFVLANGVARWKNKAEQGEKKVNGQVFYPSYYGPPEETGLLIKALAKSGKPITLLPAGEASAFKVREMDLQNAGKTQKVILYGVTGFGFTPNFAWMDPDGGLFAAGSRWSMVIREGWEKSQETLAAAQEEAENARMAQLAKEIARKPKAGVVIRNVNVFDSETGKLLPRRSVLIQGNKISGVGTDLKLDGAEVIDGKGGTLLPGLWDMHTHISNVDGLLNIAAGVTSVRDLANDTDELEARRKRYDAGQEIGPRVIAAGFMDGPGPFQGPTKVLVGTEEEARAAVRKYAQLGYPQIKIYSSIKPELVPHILDEAHKHQMRVSGHVPATMFADQFIKMGGDELQHINFVFLNFFRDVTETRNPARFIEPGKRAAGVKLDSPEVKEFINLLRERKIVVDPTLATFEQLFKARPGEMDPAFAAIGGRLPSQARRGLLGGGLPVDEKTDALYKQSYDNMVKMVGVLHRAGIQIVPGTDTLAGFGLHREFELYADAGIPNAEILQLATIRSAKLMKRDAELGSIAPGKLADLVLVYGDPVKDISAVRNTRLVIKDGVVYDPNKLYAAIGVQPGKKAE